MKHKMPTNYQLKLFFLGFWILFTSAMVVWWWFYSVSAPQTLNHNRMMMWEGLTFLAAIFIAGFFLYKFIQQEVQRHNQLKIFFSNFSHDIKTSITRLRLQSEVLQEERIYSSDEKLKQLVEDISRLDLQLENSLYIAQEEDYQLFVEQVKLSDLIQNVKNDFSEIDIFVERDAQILVDRRLFNCVLRNVINNSVVHGLSTQIKVRVELKNSHCDLVISDNGQGEKPKSPGQGHGLGLRLCQQLLEKMDGHFTVKQSTPHYVVALTVPAAGHA